jgi:hypothetical protein
VLLPLLPRRRRRRRCCQAGEVPAVQGLLKGPLKLMDVLAQHPIDGLAGFAHVCVCVSVSLCCDCR